MELDGIHHISAITGNAAQNVDFYTRVLGLRLVKKTVNQDDPTVYHLFYADEHGSPGADMTFFEYPGARPGRAGGGMVHQIDWRVAGETALDFWERRLADEGVETERGESDLHFHDPEGLHHRLVITLTDDPPLIAEHPAIPSEVALQGFDGVRAYNDHPQRSLPLLTEVLGFDAESDTHFEARGHLRGATYDYDPAPSERGVPGAGTVHHVAWSTSIQEIAHWQRRIQEAGFRPTEVIDRYYFGAVYFREPSHVLFEISTRGPGFAVDEDSATLGQKVVLPPFLESQRAKIEKALTPLPTPVRSA
jgi:glyoxalase family protein